MSKFLDKTGLDTFWAKIKNTFVKSVKITSSGAELKNSDGNVVIPLASTSDAGAMSSADKLMLDQTALLGTTTGSTSNKAYKLCRFRYGSSYAVCIEGLIRSSYAAYFKLNSYLNQSSSGSTPWSSSKLSLTYQTVNGVPNAKFYYKVGSATVGNIVDIYVFFPTKYSRYEVCPIAGCKAVSESDTSLNGVYFYNQDVTSDWSTLVTELTEITDNSGSGTSATDIPTELKVIAKAKESSGTAPVKVDAYGNLSAVTVDSAPTAGNTANLVSSDGIKKALDGKANSSDIPPAVSVKGNAESSYRTGQVNLTPANLGISANTTSVTVGSTTASIPQATTTSPKMDGTASAGSETTWAKGDHVHPTDTSREAAANKKTTLNSSSDTDFPTSKAVATYVGTAIANKVDKMSAWLKTSSGDNKSQWFTMASLNSTSTYNDISGIWDLYLKTRGQGSDGKYVMHALLELCVYTGRYDGTDGTHEQTSPIVRKARLIVEPGWPVEILLKITGKTGNVTVEIITGNFVAITNGNPCAFYMSERAKSNVNQSREWTYGKFGTSDTGDPRPVSGDNVTVISLDETDASGKYVYRRTELYDTDVKSTYFPIGTGSDAPVNGKALADALASGTASAATATALNMGQLGNAGRPVYIGNDGKPKLCDADIAVFIAEYVLNGTSTLFVSILSAYNSGRVIILKTSFSYIMLQGVSLSSGGDVTGFIFEGFVGDYIQYFSVNSNNVWSYRSIPLTISSQGAPNGALGSQTNPLSLVYSTSFVGDVTGKADSADKINTDAGSHARPVYFQNGIPNVCNDRFIYSVNADGTYSTIQYKICVGSIGNTANTFYFT